MLKIRFSSTDFRKTNYVTWERKVNMRMVGDHQNLYMYLELPTASRPK